jgi:hypothetical protein
MAENFDQRPGMLPGLFLYTHPIQNSFLQDRVWQGEK